MLQEKARNNCPRLDESGKSLTKLPAVGKSLCHKKHDDNGRKTERFPTHSHRSVVSVVSSPQNFSPFFSVISRTLGRLGVELLEARGRICSRIAKLCTAQTFVLDICVGISSAASAVFWKGMAWQPWHAGLSEIGCP